MGDTGEEDLEEDIKQVYRETQMQWMLIEKEREIECAIIVKSLAIWPKIVGRRR